MEHIVGTAEVLLELGLSASATDEERAVVAQAIAGAESSARKFLGYDPVRAERTEYYPRHDTTSDAPRSGVWEVSDTLAYMREYATPSAGDLQLQHIPIRSVKSLHVDYDARSGTAAGAFAAESLKVEGSDFWPNYDMVDGDGEKVCSDGIIKGYGAWPRTPGTVKVVYTAGYSSAELRGESDFLDARPILDAVVMEAVRRTKRMFAQKKRTGVGLVPGVVTSERLGDYSYSLDVSTATQVVRGELSSEAKALLGQYMNWGWLQ